MIHLVEGAVVNPRLELNYGGVSELGSAVGMAGVTNAKFVSTQLLERYKCTFVA